MCVIAQCHEIRGKPLRTCAHTSVLHNCCVRLCARENKTGSKFDLLSEVIFKDLAVPAVTVKLTLGSWFVQAVANCFTDTGSGGKLCSGPQTPPTLPIDTMLPAT